MAAHKPIIGLNDAFGAQAKGLRKLQRDLLALFEATGYEEVIPPILERPDSLQTGAGRFLADQTVIFSDPAGAGALAIRSDMTPQIARIAATRLQHETQLRLCYSGTVMLARPDLRGGSRQQWQTGVECLGVPGHAGDMEVMHLAARTLLTARLRQPVLQVGHIGILESLVADSTLPLEHWTALISRRSPDDLAALIAQEPIPEAAAVALQEMVAGVADATWLRRNMGQINAGFDEDAGALLELISELGDQLAGQVTVQIDAATMPRFLYHSGILFAGFAEGVAHAVLHGGRYDAMMAAHGRDMAATGFSCDLWTLLNAA